MQATNIIQNLQWFYESVLLSCKCAIGILTFMRMDILYFVFFGDIRSASWRCCFNAWLSFWPGITFGGVPLGLTPSWQVAPSHLRAATHCRPGSGRKRALENVSSNSQISKSEALREPNTKVPGFRLCFSVPPADGRGLWIGIFSRKFRENYAKKRTKINVHIEGVGQ